MSEDKSEPQDDTSAIEQVLDRAIVHHRAGALQDAERLYRAILKIQPGHPDANHNLGALAVQMKQPASGLPCFRAALEANPHIAQYWLSYIDALIQAGQRPAAREVLEQARQRGVQGEAMTALAVRLENPSHSETTALMALFNEGRYAETAVFAQTMTERFPRSALCWKVLGAAYKRIGRLGDALGPYQNATILSPSDDAAFNNLGNTFYELGRLEEAETSLRRALEINPDCVEAHCNLGNSLRNLGRLDEAAASYRHALEIKPDFFGAQCNLGVILYDLGQLDEAETCLRRALEINPNYEDAHSNLGNTLRDLGRLDEALEHYRLSLKHRGDWKDALRRLTTPLVLQTGMESDAQDATDREITFMPGALLEPVTPPVAPSLLGKGPQGLNEGGSLEAGARGRKKLRIILVYPPPWQIPAPGETLQKVPFPPPKERFECDLTGDFQVVTYGLLTIAAQAKQAGHDVHVYNLATCPWKDVVTLFAETEADVYGISAFTANRRGMGAVVSLIRQLHPQAHITAGGPFVTALPVETLRHFKDIDTVVIGEGEGTFMELLECLGANQPAAGIPGTAWRDGTEITVGPTRPRIDSLDALASPFDYFTNHIVMTSRGCPGRCTFCGSFTTWGKQLRFHSAGYCLETFKKALARLPIPFLAIKDDTFTAHRRRALEICDSIIRSQMNFIWSCDTRVDCLDDELLRSMRLAGCQMISFGVESGSPEILKTIRKATSPEMVVEATRAAQKYGMFVRYYMIIPNREETPETLQQSFDLIKTGRPNCYIVSPLSFYPGTEDWAILRGKQGLTADVFFENDFRELNVVKGRHKEYQDVLCHGICDIGAVNGFHYTVEEREAVAVRLPYLNSVHVELANAYYRVGRLDEAVAELDRAEELGYPIGIIIDNQRACIALARNEVDSSLALLERACQSSARHIGIKNLKALRGWVDKPMAVRGKLPILNDSIQAMDFNLLQSPIPQPCRPI